jgi:hypothetical protein
VQARRACPRDVFKGLILTVPDRRAFRR